MEFNEIIEAIGIEPYYRDWQSDIVIYNADCRDILPLIPDKSIDLVLTDPPYGIGEAAGKNRSRGKLAISKDYGALGWDDEPIRQELIDRIIDIPDRAIIFGGNYYYLPPTPCWLIWDKDNGATDFADCEMAWTNLDMAVRRLKWRWNGMLQEDMGNKEIRCHPTQKPLPVMKWCITKADKCGINNLILDPFLGSGTTAVAAKILGRKCIGIELEEKYCEIAAKRLSQGVFNL